MKKIKVILLLIFFLINLQANNLSALGKKNEKSVSADDIQPKISSILREEWAPGLLLVAFLDVGQGDAIVIITPSKKVIVIDTGEYDGRSKKKSSDIISNFLKMYDIKKIDCMVLTHSHSDHIGGAYNLLKNFEVGEVWDTGHKSTSALYLKILNLIKEKKIKYIIPNVNDKIAVDTAVNIRVLHCLKTTSVKYLNTNNTSIVLKLEYNNFSTLFTGDIEAPIEKNLVDSDSVSLKAVVLKAPHHGSSTSNSIDFLKAVAPQFTVISVGQNNRYNHPSQTVLNRYKEFSDMKLFRTDQQGTIEMLTDGKELKVKLQVPVDFEKLYKFFRY